MGHKKINLPSKNLDVRCHRSGFSWRKKWQRDWLRACVIARNDVPIKVKPKASISQADNRH